MTTFDLQDMIALGAKIWTGDNGKIRYYLNNWAGVIEFEVTRYKSGSISGAWVGNEKISNAKAARLLGAKVFWADGELQESNGALHDMGFWEPLLAALKAKLPN